MAVVTVTDAWTELTDGTETTDTLVQIGKDMKVALGDTTGRTYANATPMQWGQLVSVPAGVIMSAICNTGNSYPAWVEVGFSV